MRLKFKNLTPHLIHIAPYLEASPDEWLSIPPSGEVARVASDPGEELDSAPGVRLFAAPRWGDVQGLPEPDPETILIVSGLVASRCGGRPDVFGPGTGPNDQAVRDDGRVIAVTRLIQAPQV